MATDSPLPLCGGVFHPSPAVVEFLELLQRQAEREMRRTLGKELDEDERAMFTGATCDQLADWVDDLEARIGLDVAELRDRMLTFRFAKFPPAGERVLFRDVDADVMFDSVDGFDARPYDPEIAIPVMDSGYVFDIDTGDVP